MLISPFISSQGCCIEVEQHAWTEGLVNLVGPAQDLFGKFISNSISVSP